MDDRRHRLPHLIEAPARLAIWDADVAAIGLSGLVVAVVVKVFWLPVLAGVGLAFLYDRYKTGKHPAYLLDFAYWYLPPSASLLGRLPPSCIRYLGSLLSG